MNNLITIENYSDMTSLGKGLIAFSQKHTDASISHIDVRRSGLDTYTLTINWKKNSAID